MSADATKPDAGPELLEELWAIRCPDGTLSRSMDEDAVLVYPSHKEADGDSPGWARSDPSSICLVGVPPRYRDAIEAVDRLVKLTRNCVDFGDFDLDGLAAIVTEAKRGRP